MTIGSLFCVLLLSPAPGLDVQVIRCPDATKSLDARWQWARQEASSRKLDGYWVGYSFQREMERNSMIGSYYSDRLRNRPSLAELIAGKTFNEIRPWEANPDAQTVGPSSSEEDSHGGTYRREIAILVHFSRDGADHVRTTNLFPQCNLDEAPLLWLEGSEVNESVSLLSTIYSGSESSKLKKGVLEAVGLHDSPSSFAFLQKVLSGDDSPSIRGEAAFWIGQSSSRPGVVELLKSSALSDRSAEVRKKSIFALSQLRSDAATDALISVAHSQDDRSTRKEAIFWLGQKASLKAVETLKNLTDDEDADIEKSAFFALTQASGNEGVAEVAKIARSHKNPSVRKQAIYWLGQSDDPRAVDALIDILRK